MALKRKPLDIARSRLKTKLNEIEEQKSSIENYLQQMTSKVDIFNTDLRLLF